MKLTSSNFAAAIGVSPYMSRQKLWRVMTGREQRDPLNAAMQWGIDNEHKAVAGVEAHTGILFERTGGKQQHITGDWMPIKIGTTPDGVRGETGLEVKCPQRLYDSVPVHYMPQIQGQCWIADLAEIYFSPWTPDQQAIWKVPKSNEYIEWMASLLKDFMQHLIDDTEPKRRKKPVPPEVEYERIV